MRTLQACWVMMLIMGSAAFGQTASDLNEGLRVVKQPGGGSYTLQWWGKLGRSYFVEQSADLVSWSYAPVVFGGTGQVSGLGLNTTAERLFWRLRHTDAQNGGNAQLADFDSDGVSNLDEVTTGRNPFGNADADSNGLPDDWEGFNTGKFACFSGLLNVSLAQGSTTTRTLTLRNDTAQAVNWSLDMQDLLASRWLNSNTGGPAYTWEEISTTGTLVVLASNYTSHSQPVDLTQFSFPFFGTNHSTFQICTEGYIDFTDWWYSSINRSFPAYDRPPAMIAGFWDNLDPSTTGDIYFQEFSDHCVVEYKNVENGNGSGTVTFQIVLFANGAFEFRYHTIAMPSNSCTVGYQDLDHAKAETLVYNQNYLTSNMRLRWEHLPFLSASATSGTVPANSTATVTLSFTAANTEAGSVHYPSLTLTHNGTGSSPSRLPASLTVTGTDTDNDGLPNYYENAFGLNPAVNDAGLDRDLDGLTNYQEYLLGTVPNQPDSDYDEMNDGWEQLYGFPPLVNNATDADPTNDLTADPDNDGLLNTQEEQLDTNPRSADTDGDTYADTAENTGASNATGFASTPPNPGGKSSAPPASALPPVVPVTVQFGDHSVSHSEKYKVVLEPLEGDLNTQKRGFSNSKYGEVQSNTFHLPAGAKYKITLEHTGTDPKYKQEPRPDYDYTLSFTYAGSEWSANIVTQDNQNMLGVHDESYDLYASGKSATLNIAWLTSETVATVPADRKRTKIGVNEQVQLELLPSSLPSPVTWVLEGSPATGKIVPFPNQKLALLTAGFRKCDPTVTATISGKQLKKQFAAVQPSSIKVVKNQGDSNTLSPLKVDMKATIYVSPEDVSFFGLTVSEKTCNATASGFFDTAPYQLNGDPHIPGSPLPISTQLVAGKGWACDGEDHIWGGPFNPPYSAGSFTWVIPWVYGYDSDEEDIVDITHSMTMEMSQTNKATLKITKTNDAQSSATQP